MTITNEVKKPVRRDARIIQLLKKECQQSGCGAVALEKVFRGLLSVHNRRLLDFADALAEEAGNE